MMNQFKDRSVGLMVRSADDLLAELERTAKPEPMPTVTVCPACHASVREGEPLTHGQRCPVAPGAVDMPEQATPFTIINRDNTRRMIVPKWLYDEWTEARAEAAREERERIIAYLNAGMCPDIGCMDEASIRAALEPKP